MSVLDGGDASANINMLGPVPGGGIGLGLGMDVDMGAVLAGLGEMGTMMTNSTINNDNHNQNNQSHSQSQSQTSGQPSHSNDRNPPPQPLSGSALNLGLDLNDDPLTTLLMNNLNNATINDANDDDNAFLLSLLSAGMDGGNDIGIGDPSGSGAVGMGMNSVGFDDSFGNWTFGNAHVNDHDQTPIPALTTTPMTNPLPGHLNGQIDLGPFPGLSSLTNNDHMATVNPSDFIVSHPTLSQSQTPITGDHPRLLDGSAPSLATIPAMGPAGSLIPDSTNSLPISATAPMPLPPPYPIPPSHLVPPFWFDGHNWQSLNHVGTTPTSTPVPMPMAGPSNYAQRNAMAGPVADDRLGNGPGDSSNMTWPYKYLPVGMAPHDENRSVLPNYQQSPVPNRFPPSNAYATPSHPQIPVDDMITILRQYPPGTGTYPPPNPRLPQRIHIPQQPHHQPLHPPASALTSPFETPQFYNPFSPHPHVYLGGDTPASTVGTPNSGHFPGYGQYRPVMNGMRAGTITPGSEMPPFQVGEAIATASPAPILQVQSIANNPPFKPEAIPYTQPHPPGSYPASPATADFHRGRGIATRIQRRQSHTGGHSFPSQGGHPPIHFPGGHHLGSFPNFTESGLRAVRPPSSTRSHPGASYTSGPRRGGSASRAFVKPDLPDKQDKKRRRISDGGHYQSVGNREDSKPPGPLPAEQPKPPPKRVEFAQVAVEAAEQKSKDDEGDPTTSSESPGDSNDSAPRPRPSRDFVRSPSPGPLLTGAPYRIPEDSPETIELRKAGKKKRLIVKIKDCPRGSDACLCLGIAIQDHFTGKGNAVSGIEPASGRQSRQNSLTTEVHTDTPAGDSEMDASQPPSIAGMKRKASSSSATGASSKGKEREVMPSGQGDILMSGQPRLIGGPGGSASGSGGSGAGDGRPSKKKKPRIALSCVQCTKRKQKCNREIPCQHCTARRIPDQCTLYVPGQALPETTKVPAALRKARQKSAAAASKEKLDPNDSSPATTTAVPTPPAPPGQHESEGASEEESDVEMDGSSRHSAPTPIMGHAAPVLGEAGTPSTQTISSTFNVFGPDNAVQQIKTVPTKPAAPKPVVPVAESVDTSNGGTPEVDENRTDRSDKPPSGNLSRSVSVGDNPVDAAKWFATDGTVPGVETLRGNTTIALNLEDCGVPSENLQQLIKACGVHPLKLLELVNELPPYQLASRLVDWFFTQINYVRYPIHEVSFRNAFEDMYEKRGGSGPEPHNVRSLPLIFIVLATSVRLAPEEWAGNDEQRRITSLKMYWCSRRSILIATAIEPESLELVVTRLLSALYLVLIYDRRLTECWSQLGASLRTAQAIGLHRDGTKFGLDPIQTEYRRRVWSFLYHADRNYSLILGRPPAIIDAYCDTKEPMNLEFSNAQSGQPLVAKPLSEPTSSTFIILRKRFAKIVGDITYLFNKLHEPARFEEVQALNEQLNRFINDLPPHFRMENADKSLDHHPEHGYIPIHRYYLSTEILFIIITLHRPWLLRRLKSDKFALSRRACYDAAKMDFRIRQAFRAEHPGVHNAYVGGQFREFNAAMIAGIYAIIHPKGADAVEMRRIVATFIEQRPIDRAKTDQTSRREIAIIQTLNKRAKQVLELGSINASDAALLLGLRDGETSRTATTPNTPKTGHATIAATSVDATVVKSEEVPANFNQVYTSMMNGTISALDPVSTTTPVLRPKRIKARPTAPFRPLSMANHVRGGSSISGHGDLRSPASMGSHEEGPQELMDNWLSSHSSMAIGNVDSMDFGMLIDPSQLQSFNFGNAPQYHPPPNQFVPNVGSSTLRNSIDANGWSGVISPAGGNVVIGSSSQDPLMADQFVAHQMPQRDTFHGISDRMAGVRFDPAMMDAAMTSMAGIGGIEGAAGMTGMAPSASIDDLNAFAANMDGNSTNPGETEWDASSFSLDSYWNTLIDGIINAS